MELQVGQRIAAPFLPAQAEVKKFEPRDGYYQLEVLLRDGSNQFLSKNISPAQLAQIQILERNPVALTDNAEEDATVRAIFFLISPEDNPSQHLRILAQIAGRVDEDTFEDEWHEATDAEELKEALLHEERYLTLEVEHGASTASMIDRPLRDLGFPEGCLVAWLRRGGEVIVPRGSTVCQEGDRLTVIGDPLGMKIVAKRYASRKPL